VRKGTLLAAIVGLAVLIAGGIVAYYVTRPAPVQAPPFAAVESPPVSAGSDAGRAAQDDPADSVGGEGTGSRALDEALEQARQTLAEVQDPAPEPEPEPTPAADATPDDGADTTDASAAAGDAAAPAFDIVRVEPDGNAVMAGRAEPGATVTVLDAGAPIGEATADARGQWVLLPEAPLDPGDRALSLLATGSGSGSGGGDDAARASETVVVLSLPARDSDAPVLALETARGGGAGADLLQGPAAAPTTTELTIAQVDYTSSGDVALSGSAAPGTTVQLYVDNAPLARVRAGETGRWDIRPETAALPSPDDGVANLRVDQLNAAGEVTGRVEVPFQRADLSALDAEAGETMIVVQPGNNLWTVARAVYGRGIDYTVIYQANEGQIRDPDLIYPGQVFVIPAEEQAASGDR